MKIAFIICAPVISPSNGVISQALTWKNILEKRGHQIVLFNVWDPSDWTSFDIIHLFMFNEYSADYIDLLCKINPRLVFSPILDPDYSITNFKIRTLFGSKKLQLYNRYSRLRDSIPKIKKFFVRSVFEKNYFKNGLGIQEEKIEIIPLSLSNTEKTDLKSKENFCFHVSFLADERKNVKRLIEAAEKYHFRLKLAGRLRNESEKAKVMSWINKSKHVDYLGFLPYDKLIETYKRAKVFALPSLNEGVGIVALDAASLGCDIVITNIGGPQEYYSDMAIKVNPYNVDEIGVGIQELLNNTTYQPDLSNHIKTNYSLEKVGSLLENGYKKLCSR